MNIRNLAIIAHVDHGKTTLVDGLLKQAHTFRDNEAAMKETLIMDSNDLEREKGITILAKNTAITFGETKINIIDTPGHADFGGEVERTLNMADGALLVIDAQEGPMPQTKFVLKKALEAGLKIMVVVNKIDKKDARVEEVIEATHTLFLDLATDMDHLDFPVYYAIGRDGKAWDHLPADANAPADLTPLFEGIVKHMPEPKVEAGPFQMLATTLDYDSFQGKYAIGRIRRGSVKPGMATIVIGEGGKQTAVKVAKVFVSQGLKRVEVPEALAGDIVALTGFDAVHIGDTIADAAAPEAMPRISVAEPTLKMAISVNTSPFAGKEGQFVTGRQILDRINRELESNVSLRLSMGDTNEYILSGRGELHLAIFIETLRREGFELQVGKPHVITKMVAGVEMEPVEDLTIDVATDKVGAVAGEIGRRKGVLLGQIENDDGTTHLTYEITTRGILGLRTQLLTISRGTAVMNSIFLRYDKMQGSIPKLRNGVLIAAQAGKAVTYGLNIAQGRGITFIPPQTQVYEGMIVGLNSREEDIEINVAKEKKLTNMRASSADMSVILTPPTIFSLEQSLSFLEDDELLEVTPTSLRLRKKYLSSNERAKNKKRN
ncbi:MAG: translational GTPase TypA [Candidatus Andersenbacteria bacterium]|nr:translational GTPase TypA [Candidatus Andersenbacteria bacterium]